MRVISRFPVLLHPLNEGIVIFFAPKSTARGKIGLYSCEFILYSGFRYGQKIVNLG